MKKAVHPKRFLTRRDKSAQSRGKSADPAHKHRPFAPDAFFALFRPTAKQAEKDKENQQDESVKIDEVIKRLTELDIENVRKDHVTFALHSQFAAGDVDKAVEIMQLQRKAYSGTIVPYDPNVHMVGAVNRGMVTCYLDALLFAMFAKLEAFECMLTTELSGESQKRLAGLLRLWVNLLRSGKLIHTDMTELIQEALGECGWHDAQLVEQQDTSEAFAFITETLQLPLLPLQVDLFHQGKNDEADHKVVYERLLNLAVPPDTDGKGIDLEDCLEEYFNSQVHVHRDSLDGDRKGGLRATLTPIPQTPTPANMPSTPKSTIRLVNEDEDQEKASAAQEDQPSAAEVEVADETHMSPLARRWTENSASRPSTAQGPSSPTRPNRSRTESIIQRVVLDKDKSTGSEPAGLFQRAKRTASVVKAVTIPAWQFFRLIPWHSPAGPDPVNDLEVARHFSQRPVVGICLKRYMVDENGVPKRQNTYIDIPDSLRLPHFIVDERHVEESGLSQEYKLVLQVAPKLLTDNRRHDSDPPPDYEEAQWVKFDDLETSSRITPVDDIKQSLKEEMPYLLLYQIVPIVDVTASSADENEVEPPSYDDTATALQLKISQASERPVISRRASSYFDNLSTLPSTNASVRFSAELERPSRRSFADEDGFLSVSRRGSCAIDSSAGPSPIGTPLEGPYVTLGPGEETTAQRLSRAAAKFRGSGSKSRPQSQAGENRISLTMSRLSGLVRASKEPLREPLRDDMFSETDDFEVIHHPNGATTLDIEKESEDSKDKPHKEKDTKRGRSKGRVDKGKGKEKTRKDGDVPDRECIVQ
ncbi:hypothetical protein G7054_g10224 [Neopestalotiopsis clavispora]|nr:hypothetical protein G7054_g10224 [Neopestalotiopsis clavispora]